MSGSSLQFAFLNTTTIENLSRRSKVWQLAVYVARPPISRTGIGFPTITYPLGGDDTTSAPQSSNSKRMFVVLHSKPGENPWDLGPLANFKSVMGVHWYDWFLPLRHSPLRDHSRGESQFEVGQVVERMRAEAGLIPPLDPSPKPSSRWGYFRSRRSRESDVMKNVDIPESRFDERMRGGLTRHDDDDDRRHHHHHRATKNEEQDLGMELRDITAK